MIRKVPKPKAKSRLKPKMVLRKPKPVPEFERKNLPSSQATEQERDFLTTKEVAQKLDISEQTLRGWRVAGKGPKYNKIEGLVRYSVKELEIYMDGTRRGSTSEN